MLVTPRKCTILTLKPHLFSYNFYFIIAIRHCRQYISRKLLFLVCSWNHSDFCLVPHILLKLWNYFPETSSKPSIAKQWKYEGVVEPKGEKKRQATHKLRHYCIVF